MSQALFFDLDGTLLDTAQDFAYAINLMLAKRNMPFLDFDLFREQVYGESRKMVSFAFDIQENEPDFESIRQEFLHTYHQNCTKKTIFFPGMALLLNKLDEENIPWGIITSKPTWLAQPIIEHFKLDKRAASIVMGDTVSKTKPDPMPLLYACERARILPSHATYVGDLETDIIAAKASGMKSIGVTYGYHPPETDFQKWGADLIAHKPLEILQWLNTALVKI
jgi:2-phosphoglycolate phosphatase